MLRDYHEGIALSPRTSAALERMSEVLDGDAPPVTAQRATPSQFTRAGLWMGWAAAVLLAVLSVQSFQSLNASRREIAELRSAAAANNARLAALEDQARNSWPRFVALRLASAECPFCEKTRALFSELERENAAHGVFFATIDPASPEGKAQLARFFSDLKIDWAAPACKQCCAVRLLDRKERRVAASQVALLPQDEFRAQFAKVISESTR